MKPSWSMETRTVHDTIIKRQQRAQIKQTRKPKITIFHKCVNHYKRLILHATRLGTSRLCNIQQHGSPPASPRLLQSLAPPGRRARSCATRAQLGIRNTNGLEELIVFGINNSERIQQKLILSNRLIGTNQLINQFTYQQKQLIQAFMASKTKQW